MLQPVKNLKKKELQHFKKEIKYTSQRITGSKISGRRDTISSASKTIVNKGIIGKI